MEHNQWVPEGWDNGAIRDTAQQPIVQFNYWDNGVLNELQLIRKALEKIASQMPLV